MGLDQTLIMENAPKPTKLDLDLMKSKITKTWRVQSVLYKLNPRNSPTGQGWFLTASFPPMREIRHREEK